MRRSLVALSAAASALVYACHESTSPVSQDEVDEAAATLISGATFDPNAETTGGHTATPPSVTCTYNATTKWTTCGPTTQNGLTITRQMQFLDSAGNAQQKPDANTRSMKAKTTITGTITKTGTITAKPDSASGTNGTVTSTTTVNRSSEETVTGLGPTSTQRVVNGTASGTEDSEITDSRGKVTVKRQYADTTKSLTLSSVVSVNPTGGISMPSPFPLSGTIIRNSTATTTLPDKTTKTYVYRQVQTFESGGKVTITTTVNGKTQTCTVQLGSTEKPVCTQG